MSHIALICPPLHGHMHPMFSLGRELLRRGHRVTALCLPDAENKAAAAGLGFVPFGAADYPPGLTQQNLERLGTMSGPGALRFTVQLLRREAQVQLRDIPGALGRLGIDGVLVDQVSPGAASAAEAAGLPFVTVCNALMIDRDPEIPPVTLHWSYRDSFAGRMRNRLGFFALRLLGLGLNSDVNAFRRRHGLRPHETPDDWSSPLATVAQIPPEFDFPRGHVRDTFHYAGPFQDPEAREPIPFPFEKLDGRPLVYASMGTLQNRVAEQFRCIAAACADLDVQAVLALGGADPESLGPLRGSPIVLRYAPQLEMLRRASVTVTHAGLNTVMESLACGVPMVAIPVTNDQPGAAARVEWAGAGLRVHPGRLTVDSLRHSLRRILSEPSFRAEAVRLQAAIQRCRGARQASDVIETAFGTRQPVRRERA